MNPDQSAIYNRIVKSFRRQAVMSNFGAEITLAEAKHVSIRLPFRSELTQQNGYIHAGIVATIADSACGYAALTVLPEGKEVLTVEYKINLLAPAEGSAIRADASVIRSGKTLSVCRADVFAEQDGSEVAIAAMTATIFAISK
jgi:uncharacterized protein (TIGR00369 family)